MLPILGEIGIGLLMEKNQELELLDFKNQIKSVCKLIENSMIVYCDESGYTGGDLLEKTQPYFVYSAVRISKKRLSEIKDFIYKNYQVQGDEIKGKHLVNSSQGQRVLLEIFKQYSANAKIVYHDKKFALACKIVEYGIEPLLKSNYLFYKSKLNMYIATGLFLSFYIKDDTAENLFSDFLLILRGKLKVNKSVFEKYRKNDPFFEWFLNIITKNPAIILREIENEKSEVEKWILDLTMTSLIGLLTEWSKRGRKLNVICDNSKVFIDNPVVETINSWGQHGARKRFLDITLGFRLNDKIVNGNSKNILGLQIADLFASTVFYCLKNPEENFSKEIMKIVHSNCLCTPGTFCVVPGLKNIKEEFGDKLQYFEKLMSIIYIDIMSEP